MKIKGNRTIHILSKYFQTIYYPFKVFINGVEQNKVNYSYYFNNSDNYVELFWDHNRINCGNMFKECSNIYEINFPNFDSSKVETMNSMFRDCILLTSLNLSNFDTSNVKNMQNMFNSCKLITSLDLSNFNTSQVNYIDDIFDECSNLIYLNFKNFKEIKLSFTNYIFDNVPQNIFVCGNESIILPQITKKGRICYSIDCIDDWQSKQKKMVGTSTCVDNCENNSTNKYEYNGKCYHNCSNGYYIYNNIKYCKCQNVKCLNCSLVALELELCNKCNDNYYPKENDELNYGEYIECYNEIKGYYLDKINSYLKNVFILVKYVIKKEIQKIIIA